MPRIVLYSTPGDPYSVRMQEFLRRKKVRFREVSITSEDPAAYEEFVVVTGETDPPILVVDGAVLGDYEAVTSLDLRGKFDELLGL